MFWDHYISRECKDKVEITPCVLWEFDSCLHLHDYYLLLNKCMASSFHSRTQIVGSPQMRKSHCHPLHDMALSWNQCSCCSLTALHAIVFASAITTSMSPPRNAFSIWESMLYMHCFVWLPYSNTPVIMGSDLAWSTVMMFARWPCCVASWRNSTDSHRLNTATQCPPKLSTTLAFMNCCHTMGKGKILMSVLFFHAVDEVLIDIHWLSCKVTI